ncbi:hypothetical protein [Clostridium grantii]|uniref:Uncharacterized protein n=1 Tax=Clostridium grantii DSM 8605 TaxID=1121316 RepID=A0A1M5T6M4_9CLOT|nr:hypothetical protein [Clostridium grantii]SHH46417.1 hypothetical protein SAMN02745207_01228 [Clostridium grantii DSM 8605]
MNKFRNFIIPGTIALSLIGATTAFAATTDTNVDTGATKTQITAEHNGEGRGTGEGRKGKVGVENREARETERAARQEEQSTIIASAEELIPGATAEYEALQTELTTTRDALHEEMDALKTKVESGEITREEMKETLGDKIGGRGADMKTADEDVSHPWDDLETAVEAKDATGAQTAFDSILARMNSRLASLTERLSAIK